MNKKEEIMTVACDALQKRGISGFSFRDLAELTGIKSSSVHYHFRSKNDLINAIVINFREKATAFFTEVEESSKSLDEALMQVISFFESVLDDDKFCLCGMLAAEEKHLDEEVLSELKKTFEGLESWLIKTIEKYGSKVPAKTLAKLLISSLEGSLLIDRINNNRSCFKAVKETVSHLI